jgi:hypothetical protein
MGVLSGLLGHASEVDLGQIEKDLGAILGREESIEKAYKIVRDLVVFTNQRLILIDKQGVTGKKVEYHSIPYRSISHFSVETSGHFDLDAELKIWVSGISTPFEKEFKKSDAVYDVQSMLATYALR